jgi:hypothetical protein
MANLLELPLETLFMISCYLIPRDLVTMSHISKSKIPKYIWKQSLWNAGIEIKESIPDLSFEAMVKLLGETGCQRCGKSGIRRVIWEFRTRICQECFDSLKVPQREIRDLEIRKNVPILTVGRSRFAFRFDVDQAYHTLDPKDWNSLVAKNKKINQISMKIREMESRTKLLFQEKKELMMEKYREDVIEYLVRLRADIDIDMVLKLDSFVSLIRGKPLSPPRLKAKAIQVVTEYDEFQKQQELVAIAEQSLKSREQELIDKILSDPCFSPSDIPFFTQLSDWKKVIRSNQVFDDGFWNVFKLTLIQFRNMNRKQRLYEHLRKMGRYLDVMVENSEIESTVYSTDGDWQESFQNILHQLVDQSFDLPKRQQVFQPVEITDAAYHHNLRFRVLKSLIEQDKHLQDHFEQLKNTATFTLAVKSTSLLITSQYWSLLRQELQCSINNI